MVIESRGGIWAIYAHMDGAPLVTRGQEVAAGTEIGKVGDSDAPGAVHLHLAFARRAWPKAYGTDGIDPADVFRVLGLTLSANRRPVVAPGSLIACEPTSSERAGDASTPPAVEPPDIRSVWWESPGEPSPLDERGPAIGVAGLALALGLGLAALLARH